MAERLAFGPFTFERGELTLRRHGTPLSLSPKASEALAILLEAPGALVSKEAMRERLWPEGYVEDGNLTQTIYVLRKALDPEGDGRTFIETVPRRGYRFRARVWVAQTAGASYVRFALVCAVAIAFLAGSIFAIAQSRSPIYPGLSLEASRAYALGHYYWDKRTLAGTRRAIAYYRDVVRLAPRSAVGYAGLAEAYVMIANHAMVTGDLHPYYAKAESYARLALARDPRSGEALAILGFVAFDRDTDFITAERDYRAATALRPSGAEAHEFLGVLLVQHGDVAEAIQELNRAAALDPISAPTLQWLGLSYYYAHDLRAAKRTLLEALDLDRTQEEAAWYLIRTEEQLGETRAATAAIAEERNRVARFARTHSGSLQDLAALRALVALRAGNRALALQVMPDPRPERYRPHDVDATVFAALNLQLGRRGDALAWLRLGLHEKHGELRALIVRDPELTDLTSDKRLRRMLS